MYCIATWSASTSARYSPGTRVTAGVSEPFVIACRSPTLTMVLTHNALRNYAV